MKFQYCISRGTVESRDVGEFERDTYSQGCDEMIARIQRFQQWGYKIDWIHVDGTARGVADILNGSTKRA